MRVGGGGGGWQHLGRGGQHALGNLLQLKLSETQIITQAEAVVVGLQAAQLTHHLVTSQLLHAHADRLESLEPPSHPVT